MKKIVVLIIVLIVSLSAFAQNLTKGLVAGTPFGTVLVFACVYDNEDLIVKQYTASESFKHHSKEDVLKYYKSLDFNSTDKWEFNSLVENSDGTITHKYTSTRKVYGTNSKIVRIKLKDEDNRWKIILPANLNQTFK